LISAGVRGASENCFPTALNVVVIRSAANARVAFEALGRASRINTWTIRSPDAIASCLGRIAVERCGVIKRHTHGGFIALGSNECVDQIAQSFERRSANVLEDAAQQPGRLPPFVAL
jgi:hypothetical protein